MTRISIIILTYKRDDIIEETLKKTRDVFSKYPNHEIILVDNNEDWAIVDRKKYLVDHVRVHTDDPEEKIVVCRGNVGVTQGRNAGIAASTGEILLFLDDDAWLEVSENFAADLVERFVVDPKLGAIAFRSFVGESRFEDPKEFPHTDKSKDHSKAFETFRFIGVAHALRKNAIYPRWYCDGFFYGMEEFDISCRLIKAGYKIFYEPSYSVRHMKVESGRQTALSVYERMYRNKLAVLWMHFPMENVIVTGALWFVKTVLDSKSAKLPFIAIKNFALSALNMEYLPRRPSRQLVSKIRQLGGSPWK